MTGGAAGTVFPGVGNAVGALVGSNIGGASAAMTVVLTGADERAHDAVITAYGGKTN